VILDRLDNAVLYRPLGERIALAFDYLRKTDFVNTPAGRYKIQGDQVIALVLRYLPKPADGEVVWESHRRYLDIQYVVEGVDWMGYAPLRDDTVVTRPYNDQEDALFYAAKGSLFRLAAGDFAIFFPNDIHAPGLAANGEIPAQACKVVMKCLID
jgi:YhcH/YjgK/YiaL family protein